MLTLLASFKPGRRRAGKAPASSPLPSSPPSPSTETPPPERVTERDAADASPSTEEPGSPPPAVQPQRFLPRVAAGQVHQVDLSSWEALGWCSKAELNEKLSTHDLGLAMGVITEPWRQKIISFVKSQEALMTSVILRFPTQLGWDSFGTLAKDDVAAVEALVESMVNRWAPELVTQVVASLEHLAKMLKDALNAASLEPAGRWLTNPLPRINYYAAPLLLLLSLQRLQDSTPPTVLEQLGRGGSTVMECRQSDDLDANGTPGYLNGRHSNYSVGNMNLYPIRTLFGRSPPVHEIQGITLAMIYAVYVSAGHAVAFLLGWWYWCPRCRKWIFVWDMSSRRQSDGRSVHTGAVNQSIELNLSFIYSVMRGMVLISSRRGHDETSMTKTMGKGGAGRSTKPQFFPTALQTSRGLDYLGFTLRTEPADAQLVDITLSPSPAARAPTSNPMQDASSSPPLMVAEKSRLRFRAFPAHVLVWRITCWSPVIDNVWETEDMLVPLVLASLSTSAAIAGKDGKYRYNAIPVEVRRALESYWHRQRIYWVTKEAEVEAKMKEDTELLGGLVTEEEKVVQEEEVVEEEGEEEEEEEEEVEVEEEEDEEEIGLRDGDCDADDPESVAAARPRA